MKFSAITLKHPGMDFEARLRENTYNFSTRRGWDIELDGAAVVMSHPERSGLGLPPVVIPFASVERADLLVEQSEPTEEKRGPGRPKKSA